MKNYITNILKRFFKGWNIFEYIFFFAAIIVPTTLGIVFNSGVLQIIAGVLAVVQTMMFAKGKIEGYFLAIAFIVIYAIVAWNLKLYGEIIIQLVVTLPIIITGVVSWARHRHDDHEDGQVVIVGHVGRRELILLILSQLFIGTGLYFMLRAFDTVLLISSTLSVCLSIIAGYLLIRRSRKSMIANVASDINGIVMWSLLLAMGEPAAMVLLAMEAMFLIIDIYGSFEWRNMKKRQRRVKKKLITVEENLTLQDFEDMENIEKQYFSPINIMPAAESFELYLKDHNHICCLKQNNRIIGFAMALSLKEKSFNDLKTGKIDETDLGIDDIDLSDDAYSYIYLSSIAIDKSFRNNLTLVKLFKRFRKHISGIISNGANVREVIADVITPEGKKLARRLLRMQPVLITTHNSTIYWVDGKTFTRIITHSKKQLGNNQVI